MNPPHCLVARPVAGPSPWPRLCVSPVPRCRPPPISTLAWNPDASRELEAIKAEPRNSLPFLVSLFFGSDNISDAFTSYDATSTATLTNPTAIPYFFRLFKMALLNGRLGATLLLIIVICNGAPGAWASRAPRAAHAVARVHVVAHAVGDDVTFSCRSPSVPVVWIRKKDHKLLSIGEQPYDDSVQRRVGAKGEGVSVHHAFIFILMSENVQWTATEQPSAW
jgi:hypothetical protein